MTEIKTRLLSINTYFIRIKFHGGSRIEVQVQREKRMQLDFQLLEMS